MWTIVNIGAVMKKNGMSLVEVLIAGALLAGLGLVVARISEQSRKVTKTTETNIEMLSLIQDISYILSDKDSCIATVQGAVGSNLTSIKRVREGATTDVYSINSIYGNGTYRLSRLTTELINGGVNLVVDMSRVSESMGGKGIRKKIPLKAVLSVDGAEITDCFSNSENILEAAVRASCKGNSARYDDIAMECYHDVALVACQPGQAMQQIITENGEIKSECAPVSSPVSAPSVTEAPSLSEICISFGGNWNGAKCDISSEGKGFTNCIHHSHSAGPMPWAGVTCPDKKRAISGSCMCHDCGGNHLIGSKSYGVNAWQCLYSGTVGKIYAEAHCCDYK